MNIDSRIRIIKIILWCSKLLHCKIKHEKNEITLKNILLTITTLRI
jgi:hypothetical protein